jgi:hypothetical protein
MQENWKPAFTTLLLNELSRRTNQTLKIASAAFSEEIEKMRETLTESEFLLFVESEPNRIKKSPSWAWFYKLKSKYKTIKSLERFWIDEHTASLLKPPGDISDLVSSIEQNQDYKLFLEGLKLQHKIGLLRSAAPVKLWRKYDPFADALKQAIEDEKLHLGNTPAKIEFVERIAGMLEAQVNWRFNEFFNEVDVRFERLNRENERLLFLEEQRKTLQNNKAIAFFDKKLYHTDNALETRERVEIAIQMEIDPTIELLEVWQNSNPKPAGLIQSIPFLTQMIDGWVEAKKFEFIEHELELRKEAMVKSDILPPQPTKLKKTEEKVLPELEGILRYPERIPSLWKHLTSQQERGKGETEIFDEGGYIGSSERNAAPLMGVAEGLRTSFQVKSEFTAREVYQALCKRYNVEPTTAPHKAKQTIKFKDVFNWVREFYGKT